MFDIGFWELAVIFVVALLVLGPDRLPAVARTGGRWASKARRTVLSQHAPRCNSTAVESGNAPVLDYCLL